MKVPKDEFRAYISTNILSSSYQKMSQHDFPEEILIEILKRVPVKSIGQFTIVSKEWHTLITSPSFISTHIHYALNNIGIEKSNKEDVTLFLRSGREMHCALLGGRIEKLGFSFEGYCRVIGTAMGLVCLVTSSFDGSSCVQNVILWNPSIRRSFVLPQSTIKLAFPRRDFFGFGVNLRDCEDCKVVRLVYPRLRKVPVHVQVEVYSLKRRTWKRLVQPGVNCWLYRESRVLMNGHLHWFAYQIREGVDKNLILAFDMANEVFSEIMVPDEFGRRNPVGLCCNLFEKNLTAINYDITTDPNSCCIWLMKEYGVVESWTSTYTFDLVEGMMKVLCVLGDGVVLVTKGQNEVVSYDIKTSTIKKIGAFGLPCFVDQYVESLALLRE